MKNSKIADIEKVTYICYLHKKNREHLSRSLIEKESL